MDANSLRASLASAAKVALGAVLLVGDAIRATISSNEGGESRTGKTRRGKKRRMKRKKDVSASHPPGGEGSAR